MSEQPAGKASFGLDMEQMILQAWRIFTDRPLTILGVSLLLTVAGAVAHVFLIGAFFWLPFSLCIPFATVMILSRSKTDRVFLGWVDRYPSLLAIFLPAAISYLILLPLVIPYMSILDEVGEVWPLCVLIPILVEKTLSFTFGLAGLLAVRRNLPPTVAIAELFATKRHAVEAFLLGGVLALLSLSGVLVCCIGLFATTAFAWICMGVAYYQIFEA